MPEIDADDDTVRRYVVCHYRYDPDRRERRNVILTAFDRSNEYDQHLAARVEMLAAANAGAGTVWRRLALVAGGDWSAGQRVGAAGSRGSSLRTPPCSRPLVAKKRSNGPSRAATSRWSAGGGDTADGWPELRAKLGQLAGRLTRLRGRLSHRAR